MRLFERAHSAQVLSSHQRGQRAWDHIKVPIFYTQYFAPIHSLLYEFIPCTIGCLVASLAFMQDYASDTLPILPGHHNQNIFRHCQISPGRQNQPFLRTTKLDNAVNSPDSTFFNPFTHQKKTNSKHH